MRKGANSGREACAPRHIELYFLHGPPVHRVSFLLVKGKLGRLGIANPDEAQLHGQQAQQHVQQASQVPVGLLNGQKVQKCSCSPYN